MNFSKSMKTLAKQLALVKCSKSLYFKLETKYQESNKRYFKKKNLVHVRLD